MCKPCARSTDLWSLMLLGIIVRIHFRRKRIAHLTPVIIGLTKVSHRNVLTLIAQPSD